MLARVEHDASVFKTTYTDAINPKEAAAKIYNALSPIDEYELILFFFSVHQNLDSLSQELTSRFKDTKIMGCTSAGEITPEGYGKNTITALALSKRHFVAESCFVKDLASFSAYKAKSVLREMQEKAKEQTKIPHTNSFAISLLDGLSIKQEKVLEAMTVSLDDVPLVGGSAGDDYLLTGTNVFYDGNFYSNGAVFILINTDLKFEIVNTHHLSTSHDKLVVTKADPETRSVQEFNAEPAALEYCRVTGLSLDELQDPTAFALHPFAVKFGEEVYARAIQKVNDDLSLTFFCALDVGVVLTKAFPNDLVSHTKQILQEVDSKFSKMYFSIAYDCIHRRIEAEKLGVMKEMSKVYKENNVIGFNSYGEQFEGKHLNHTLSLITIGR